MRVLKSNQYLKTFIALLETRKQLLSISLRYDVYQKFQNHIIIEKKKERMSAVKSSIPVDLSSV